MLEILNIPARREGAVWFYTQDGRVRQPHRHAELEFNLITRGTGAYLLGERRYDLRPGSLVWLFPGQNHVLLRESTDYTMWIVVFKPTLLAPLRDSEVYGLLAEDDPPGRFCRWLPPERVQRLVGLLEEAREGGEEDRRHRVGLEYLLLTAWTAFQQAEETPTGRNVHPAVERAVNLLREGERAQTLDGLARECSLSPARLSRLFHAQTGIPLAQFRNRQRLARFLALYGQGQRTRLAAALEAGFGSYPQFQRVFRQLMGCAPSQYREATAATESVWNPSSAPPTRPR